MFGSWGSGAVEDGTTELENVEYVMKTLGSKRAGTVFKTQSTNLDWHCSGLGVKFWFQPPWPGHIRLKDDISSICYDIVTPFRTYNKVNMHNRDHQASITGCQ